MVDKEGTNPEATLPSNHGLSNYQLCGLEHITLAFCASAFSYIGIWISQHFLKKKLIHISLLNNACLTVRAGTALLTYYSNGIWQSRQSRQFEHHITVSLCPSISHTAFPRIVSAKANNTALCTITPWALIRIPQFLSVLSTSYFIYLLAFQQHLESAQKKKDETFRHS